MLTEPVTIKSFEPIANEDCSILILGTMPGNQSLDQKQYYGHPDNIFWDIMIRVLLPTISEEQIEAFTYTEKENLLLQNGIALWDVLQFCNRQGNLDSKIRNEIKNDFETFFARHKKISKIIFNGQKAEKYFDSCFSYLIDKHGLTKTVLPSTSSSHSLNAFKKLKQWRAALIDRP
ncbi:MAG: DNA-deoxyinosine glycosylase [Chitinophagaceae bacterium]|nr:DNA-deoxyinosine glycosylase [Chitinophagaceae bacterium]